MYTIVIKANNKTLRIAKSDKSLLLFPKILSCCMKFCFLFGLFIKMILHFFSQFIF